MRTHVVLDQGHPAGFVLPEGRYLVHELLPGGFEQPLGGNDRIIDLFAGSTNKVRFTNLWKEP